MKRKIFSILLTLVLALSLCLVTAVPVAAEDPVVLDRATAITTTADRLVDLQSTTDFGWDYDVTELSAHSGSDSAYNMYGVVILGLLDAYGETDTASYLDAATAMANHMTQGTASNGDFYKQGGVQEPAGAYDYQFLMRYAEVSGNSTYSDYAIALWDWNKMNTDIFASPSALNDELLGWAGSDPGAAAWQLAAFGEASRLMGDGEFATGCADLIMTDLENSGGLLVGDHMALAECLEFLSELDPVTYSTTIERIITDLVEAQQADGHWAIGFCGSVLQDNSYPVRALAAYGGTDGLDAARKGAAWLIARQLDNGGWLEEEDGLEYSETDAEVLRALVATKAPVTIDDLGYYSIQDAINSASPEATIKVAAGTYAEQLTITEAVTLDGANAGINAVTGERGDESIIDVSGFTGDGIKVSADTVTIDGFEIIGIPYLGSGSSNVNPTIAAEEANYVTVRNCVFNTSGDALGKEAMVARPGTNHISFLDNKVNNYMFGITARGLNYGGEATLPDDGVTYLTVSGNTFNVGYVDTGSQITGMAVQIQYGDNIVVTGNTINGPGTFEDSSYALINSIGIVDFMSGYGAEGTITYSNNEVTNCYVGIGTFAVDGEISGNTVTGNNIGIQIGQVDTVYISTPAEGVAITGNDIQNNIRGIWAQNFVVDGLAAHFNNITGNTDYGVLNEDPEDNIFDATNNWWGHASGPRHATNELGTGDAVSGNVLYEPWLGYEVGSTTKSTLTTTATYSVPPLVIGIFVTPSSMDFGDVTPGVAVPPLDVSFITVTNNGNVLENFDVEITNESHSGVYNTGLETEEARVALWTATNVVADGVETLPDITLTVPLGTPPGTYTATLVFWAEAAQ